MMLTELPAMDAVSVSSVSVLLTTDFSFGFNLGFTHILAKPSTWLVLLVSLVLISSIRAAFLLLRPHTWTEGRKGVSFVTIAKSESSIKPVGTVSTISQTSQGRKEKSISPTPIAAEGTKTSSWLWGLVQWDTLPPVHLRSDRPSWQPPPSTAQQIQESQTQTRRPSSPPFEPPLPALYDTKVPLSMAKMIMSRHTFRRPPSRPPPVRATNVPQYQRKLPSMV